MIKSLFCAGILVLLWGCSKDKTIGEIVMDGSWQASVYMEGGVAKTKLLEGYVFVFKEKNVVYISKDNTTYIEDWFSNTSYDGTKNFEFSITTPELKIMEGTWKVMGSSSSALSLSLPGDSTHPVKKLNIDKI